MISSQDNKNRLCIPQADARFCLQWIQDTYQCHFQRYVWDHCWRPIADNEVSWTPEQFQQIHDHIESIGPSASYEFRAVQDELSLVLLPIKSSTGETQIAVGYVPTKCAENLADVMNLLLEQLDLNRLVVQQYRLLEKQAAQKSLELEELSWFRSLVDNLAFKEDASSLTKVANAAMEQLKEMLQVESLSVVLRQPSTETQEEVRRAIAVGTSPLNSAEWKRLLELAGSNAVCETFVDQRMRGLLTGRSRQTRAVAIVPAICSRRCFGWLIAVGGEQPARGKADPWIESDPDWQLNERKVLLLESAASVLATHAHNQRLLSEQQELLLGTVRSLVNTIDTKDRYTWGHSDRVAQIAQEIAEEYGLSEQECEKIYLAGLLHDIGKIGVRDEVLQKPGGLTTEEFEEIKAHPEFGYEILKHLSQLQHVLPGVLHHHESWDGTGYPHQLAEYEIPLAARILAVADAYDAMTSDRPYRKGMPTGKAEGILRQGSGQQWDTEVVDAFFRIINRVHEISNSDPTSFPILSSQEPSQDVDSTPQQGYVDPLLAAIRISTQAKEPVDNDGKIPEELEDTAVWHRRSKFPSNS